MKKEITAESPGNSKIFMNDFIPMKLKFPRIKFQKNAICQTTKNGKHELSYLLKKLNW